ncbi:MAG TPA: copper oxidase [Thermoanaerobaculia bacterium]
MGSPLRSVGRRSLLGFWLAVGLAANVSAQGTPPELPAACKGARLIKARVAALDQPFSWNRLGAVQPQGMIYALEDDVVHLDQDESSCAAPRLPLEAGKVRLRRDKRPRPLVLRVHAGDCLQIDFRNLLIADTSQIDEEAPHTRAASVHVVGMQNVLSIRDSGMNVGANSLAGNGVVPPGGKTTYYLHAESEGTYLLYSGGAIAGGEGLNGSISAGLFGAVNVEPAGSEWYRSQATQKDLALASRPGPEGFPVIDYDAVYRDASDPAQCRRLGKPILKMLGADNEIVHSDLTALVTGPGRGSLGGDSTKVYPDRRDPFREFTIIFHDEIGAVQAFPHFKDRILEHTLHSVRDAFAINYGTGGAGAEVLANRLGVGPMHDCAECKYEEFFLTSWAVGDPAMVVDVPASAPCKEEELRQGVNCTPKPGPKATRAYYPDDPSNVYHSYLNDRVIFRNLHAGSDDHHIFHLHAHQWVHSPKSDLSSYLDSQAIGPGAGFTYEIAYHGSGNRNRTVGDAIFHCHFYPHFAQGMWSLWRVHDVLETGTAMGADGRPASGSRALPDGEIAAGTPIPAVVPLPGLAMAPLPGKVEIVAGQPRFPAGLDRNPGYPFFVPGVAGHRPPQPPMDMIHDGGLPRHVALDGEAVSRETRLDFSKELHKLSVRWLAEGGEPVERRAMDFHAQREHRTPTPGGVFPARKFRTNGAPAVAGAPFADPCVTDDGRPVRDLRRYKAAGLQLDVVFNKAGWHFPQERLLVLNGDVADTLAGKRPPEPFFFRARSGECVEYQHTNLIPNEYHLDDFQVRTPTDILGQHIHLVKFDVLASDGGGNGFNYEDGTLSPEEVQERICAIRQAQPDRCGEALPTRCAFQGAASERCPVPEVHPEFPGNRDADCDGVNDFLGAQTTVQRWWADPITTQDGKRRTLRTVFTHDHFGPSSHQQVGYYAGLVVEPPGSKWYHNDTGAPLGVRADGGPTSWQAVIEGRSARENYREFLFEFSDFQAAYEPGSPRCPRVDGDVLSWADPARAINPAGRKLIGPPLLYEKPKICKVNDGDPDGTLLGDNKDPAAPCPDAVAADDSGMVVVNYRNEPLALRVRDPGTGGQTAGEAGDLSFAYETRTDRADSEFNKLPYAPHLARVPYPPITEPKALQAGDPFTPLLRAYEGDPVQIRVLVGAHEEEHQFSIHGLKWQPEPDDPNSGYRASQNMGISEWFDLVIPRVPSLRDGESADFLYKPTSAAEWQWSGAWGLLRLYRTRSTPADRALKAADEASLEALDPATEMAASDLPTLQLANPFGRVGGDQELRTLPAETPPSDEMGPESFREERVLTTCPIGSPLKKLAVAAVAASEVLADDGQPVPGLIYNSRPARVKTYTPAGGPPEPAERSGPLHDPTAILFVHAGDLTTVTGPDGSSRPRLKPGVKREPLILRVRAGDCIQVTLTNQLPASYADQDGWNAVPMYIEGFNANQVRPSLEVGLHPQLVSYDVARSDGVNAGINRQKTGRKQTVAPGETITYHWYAGELEIVDVNRQRFFLPKPIELGAAGLSSSDPIKHANKGAVGALIVEPRRASWTEDVENGKLTRATATVTTPTERFRELVLVFQDNVNLRYADGAPVESLDLNEDPTESAQKAINYRTEPLWFRIGVAPDTPTPDTRTFTSYDQTLSNLFKGIGDPQTPILRAKAGEAVRVRAVHPGGHTQAHVLEIQGHLWEELPYRSKSTVLGSNSRSETQGTRGGLGPTGHLDVLLRNGAGGKFRVAGDYLIRDYAPWLLYDGIWGLLRVLP